MDYYPYESLAEVMEAYPEDITCGFCGKPNFKWDDLGFYYVTDPKDGEYKPTCAREGCPYPHTAER